MEENKLPEDKKDSDKEQYPKTIKEYKEDLENGIPVPVHIEKFFVEQALSDWKEGKDVPEYIYRLVIKYSKETSKENGCDVPKKTAEDLTAASVSNTKTSDFTSSKKHDFFSHNNKPTASRKQCHSHNRHTTFNTENKKIAQNFANLLEGYGLYIVTKNYDLCSLISICVDLKKNTSTFNEMEKKINSETDSNEKLKWLASILGGMVVVFLPENNNKCRIKQFGTPSIDNKITYLSCVEMGKRISYAKIDFNSPALERKFLEDNLPNLITPSSNTTLNKTNINNCFKN